MILRAFAVVIFLLFTPNLALSSGSWVGNSPVKVAYEPLFTPRQFDFSSSENVPVSEWNSLLLPEGKHRFSMDLSYFNHGDEAFNFNKAYLLDLVFSYDYGFTKNLTSFSFIKWGYSLKSGNGLGNEWALISGLVDGFAYGSETLLSIGPGLGLAYSYSEPEWRIVATSTVSGYYNFKLAQFLNSRFKNELSYIRWLGNNWGVGLTSAYLVDTCVPDIQNCERTRPYFIGPYSGFDPVTFSLMIPVGKQTDINLKYRPFNPATDIETSMCEIGYSYTW